MKKIAMLFLSMLLPLASSAANSTLSIEPFNIKAGETQTMLIDLNNSVQPVTMVEFYAQLPEGLSIAQEEDNPDIAGRTTWKKHTLTVKTSGNVTHFLLASSTNELISGNSGAIISVKVTAGSTFSGGTIVLSKQLITSPDLTESKPADYSFKVEPPLVLDQVAIAAKSYTRQYGDDNPVFGYEITSGAITSGKPVISCAATKDSPVGTYKIMIEEGTVSNAIVTVVSGTLTITPAPLTISAGSYTKQEGEANPTFTPTFSGFKNGETSNVLTKQPVVSCSANASSAAGTYPVTVSGAEAKNYSITYQNGTLTVTAKPQPKAEPYAVYNNGTLTFYCDTKRSSRTGTSYDLTYELEPKWAVNNKTTKVVFDSSFATARPEKTSNWFFNFDRLTSIQGLENLNTSEAKDMSSMFEECSALKELDLSHFDTHQATYMNNMFRFCSSLTKLDLSSFDTRQSGSLFRMFEGCTALKTLVLGSYFESKNNDYHSIAFIDCSSLSKVSFTGDIPASIHPAFFAGVGTAASPATLDVPKEYREHYAAKFSGIRFFGGYFKLSGDTPQPETEPYAVYNNGTLTFYYDTKRSSRAGTTYSLNEGYSYPEWKEHAEEITTIIFDVSFANARPVSTCNWFWGCHNLTDFQGIEHLNTSSVTKMNSMFRECTTLTKLDLSHFKTSNVEDMGCMFQHCRHLEELDLSSFNTEKLIDINCMFFDCQKLAIVNLSSFNTSNVKYFSNMFQYCYKLTELDLSNFNTMNASESFHNLFAWCNELANLKLGSGFVSTNDQDCSDSFKNCRKLVNVNFTGDIPATINSMFFEGVGTASNPATLDVPAEYRDHYVAKMNDSQFFGGYFKLSGDGPVPGRKGDLNDDGEVNSTDLVIMVNMIMGNTEKKDIADLNSDGQLNSTDLVMLVNIIMGE